MPGVVTRIGWSQAAGLAEYPSGLKNEFVLTARRDGVTCDPSPFGQRRNANGMPDVVARGNAARRRRGPRARSVAQTIAGPPGAGIGGRTPAPPAARRIPARCAHPTE